MSQRKDKRNHLAARLIEENSNRKRLKQDLKDELLSVAERVREVIR